MKTIKVILSILGISLCIVELCKNDIKFHTLVKIISEIIRITMTLAGMSLVIIGVIKDNEEIVAIGLISDFAVILITLLGS